jgi:hypothetical protein
MRSSPISNAILWRCSRYSMHGSISPNRVVEQYQRALAFEDAAVEPRQFFRVVGQALFEADEGAYAGGERVRGVAWAFVRAAHVEDELGVGVRVAQKVCDAALRSGSRSSQVELTKTGTVCIGRGIGDAPPSQKDEGRGLLAGVWVRIQLAASERGNNTFGRAACKWLRRGATRKKAARRFRSGCLLAVPPARGNVEGRRAEIIGRRGTPQLPRKSSDDAWLQTARAGQNPRPAR